MPMLKAINGHTGCARIEAYLEKDGRALMRDFFNLSWDELEDKGLDESLKDEVRWASEMDALRRDCGNDEPWKGQRAITFRHYVISPDPGDCIDLEGLRNLAHAWVREHFSDYQVAIVYHDDNRNRIPHAHIVVNNTNLATGRRLHIPNALELNRSLQRIAEGKGLTAFDNRMPQGGAGCRDEKTPPRPRTRQEVYIGKAERGLIDAGAYSWVADIRNRVSVAKVLSRNEGEFMRILELMEVDVAENSAKAPREDWIFSLADQPSRKVSGERLGMTFGKVSLTGRFARIGSYRPDVASSRAILAKAADAVELNDLAELDRLAKAVEVNARYSITAGTDYARRIEVLQKRLERDPSGRSAAHCAEQIEDLSNARDYAMEHSLTPAERPKGTQQGGSARRWQYEPKGSGSRQQGAMQGGSAAASRNQRDRSQEGRSR